MPHLISRIVFLCIVFALTANASEPVSENPLNKGQAAFNAGDFKSSFALWQTEATNGNPDAQVFVGLSYANGWGVRKNTDLASIWYLKAAKNNHPVAQLLLGLHYIQKSGADRAAGLQWLQRAADAGDATAQEFLRKGRSNGWFNDIHPTEDQANKANTRLNPLALASPVY